MKTTKTTQQLVVPLFSAEPSVYLKDLIDECVNEVLDSYHAGHAQTSLGKCADYALVSMAILPQLFPGSFEIVAGSKIIDCGRGGFLVLSPTRSSRRSSHHLEELREYHCWIEYQISNHGLNREREIIDFTVRHDKKTVESFARTFDREISNPYVWSPFSAPELTLPPALKSNHQFKKWNSTYLADSSITKLLKKYSANKNGLIQKCSGAFFILFAERMKAFSNI